MSIITYSDHDMQCPGSWENGFKEARVMRFGDGERMLSHMRTGDWSGSTFSMTISDYDRSIRERLASESARYWQGALTVKMTDRATRAALGVPYVVFVGPIIEAQPTGPSAMAWEITLGDIVSQALLSDQAQAPWRRIGDGFLSQLSEVAEGLDPDTPEPIIYGTHTRVPGDPPSGSGLFYTPTYLGTMVIGDEYHVWLVAGHACADILDWFVVDPPGTYTTVSGDEGTDWWVPHWPAWLSLFPDANFADLRSDIFSNDRRYTLILGKVGNANPDDCADGTKTLAVSIEGIEPVGDGSGTVITDRIDQYKHFAINFVANQGAESYQSGVWLTNPTWSVFDTTVDIIDEDSFDAAQAISLIRFPVDGYTGAGIIGGHPGDRKSLREWIAGWNRSCSVRFGISHLGQVRIFMLHPTQAIKDAAPLFDETNSILKDSFQPQVLWSEHANRIPFLYDFNHATREWMGVDAYDEGISIVGYGRVILGETREYPFAPGITNATHLAIIEGRIARFPPIRYTLESALSPLGTMDLGDYVRYRHFASIGGSPAEIRLGWIERHQVQAGKRRVQADIIDVEELIGFDEEVVPEMTSPGNDTCATAIEVTLDGENHFSLTLDTSANATDSSVSGSPNLFVSGPGIAYHAAWFTFTAPEDGNFSFVTTASNYDTQLAFLTGTCGSPSTWTLEAYSDNFPAEVNTSGATLDMTTGQEIYILVFGYGPDDGGTLVVTVTFAPA